MEDWEKNIQVFNNLFARLNLRETQSLQNNRNLLNSQRTRDSFNSHASSTRDSFNSHASSSIDAGARKLKKKRDAQVVVRPFSPATTLAVVVASSEHGALEVKTRIMRRDHHELAFIFNALLPNLIDLMVHRNGWAVISSLIAAADTDMKTSMVLHLAASPLDCINACKHLHGCGVMKELVEHLDTDEQKELFAIIIAPDAVELIMHDKGHVPLDECFKRFKPNQLEIINKKLATSWRAICTDPVGCHGIQISIQNSRGDYLRNLALPIINNALNLTNHKSGNYVIQKLLHTGDAYIITSIFNEIRCSCQMLSFEQSGSNVVQELLKVCSVQEQEAIITEFISNPDMFEMMLDDKYANYVIQDAWKSSQGRAIHLVLDDILRSKLPQLRGQPYGKHIARTITHKNPRKNHNKFI